MVPMLMLVTAHGVEPTCMSLHWHVVDPMSRLVLMSVAMPCMAVALTFRDPFAVDVGAMTRPVLHVCTLLPTRRGIVMYMDVR